MYKIWVNEEKNGRREKYNIENFEATGHNNGDDGRSTSRQMSSIYGVWVWLIYCILLLMVLAVEAP